jgi:hypothetical protein
MLQRMILEFFVIYSFNMPKFRDVYYRVTDGSRMVQKKKYSVVFQLEMSLFLQN